MSFLFFFVDCCCGRNDGNLLLKLHIFWCFELESFGKTPPEAKMEPENGPLEKEISTGKSPFSVSMLNFQGVYITLLAWYIGIN